VMLAVTDTGIGMSKEVQEQIFDPFFTTKEQGKGTGLGLSMVYGIVKQSGGDIVVYSEEGKGTTFTIYLPRVYETTENLKKERSGHHIPRGTETIMVVEDEEMVRSSTVSFLRKQGYRVLEAGGGEEALGIGKQEQGRIDLILTDVVMPKMSGWEFIRQFKQIRNDFNVLYMSGYTEEKISRHGVLEQGIHLMHKPFALDKLARKIREIIDKK